MKKLNNSRVLFTGGSGLLGKHMNKLKPEYIYISSKDCDLTKEEEVHRIMKEIRPKLVIHAAARVGGIMENIKYPVQYFEENILINTNILSKSHEFNVDNFIGILSSCAYPDVFDNYPLKEDALFLGPPTKTNFSYGYAKRCMAVLINAYREQFNKNWSYLIPCNLFGEYDKFDLQKSHFVSALIRKIYEAEKNIELFGSGKPLRQFMYAEDLAKVIIMLVERNIYDNFNVGTKEVCSIKQIAEIGLNACNKRYLTISVLSNSKKTLNLFMNKPVDVFSRLKAPTIAKIKPKPAISKIAEMSIRPKNNNKDLF